MVGGSVSTSCLGTPAITLILCSQAAERTWSHPSAVSAIVSSAPPASPQKYLLNEQTNDRMDRIV